MQSAISNHKSAILLILLAALPLAAAPPIRVVAGNPGAATPYDTWDNAASNIHDAVNFAPDFSTVTVSDGVYRLTTQIVINKPLTLQSHNSADATIIDGQGAVRCIVANAGSPTITGFTITNGHAAYGGGVVLDHEAQLISCTIVGNVADGDGGGVYCIAGGTGAVMSCTVIRNRAAYGNGGGINAAGPWNISGGTISRNVAVGDMYGGGSGGGIYCSGGSGTVSFASITLNEANAGLGGGVYACDAWIVDNCTIVSNTAHDAGGWGGNGGGVYLLSGAGLNGGSIMGNVADTDGGGLFLTPATQARYAFVEDNEAHVGGGIYCASGGAVFDSNIRRNRGYMAGGGVYTSIGGTLVRCTIANNAPNGVHAYGDDFSMTNCLVTGNYSGSDGAGALIMGGGAVVNCTIASNASSDEVGGLFCQGNVQVVNCVVAGNTGIDCSNSFGNGTATFAWCSLAAPPRAGSDGGGNIMGSPLFLMDGFDFHLRTNSPCIDTASNMAWMVGDTDIDGMASRICGAGPDRGAYEYDGAPRCAFSAGPVIGIVPLTSQYTAVIAGDTSYFAGAICEWDFNGDRLNELSGPAILSPSHIYPAAGMYTNILWITNEIYTLGYCERPLYITALDPLVADFTADGRTGGAPFEVAFTDLSTNMPHQWFWDFNGDGTIDDTNQHPMFTYAATGTFTVSLTVSNDFGAGGKSGSTSTKTGYIVVPGRAVIADFSAAPATVTNGQTVQFTDASVNGPAAWAWDYDDDGTVDSTLQNPVTTYSTAGSKNVRLAVSNWYSGATVVKSNVVRVLGATLMHYVALNGGHVPPYTTWATAATNIPAALAEPQVEDLDTVLVSNGTYVIGSQIAVMKAVTIRGIAGASGTVVDGNFPVTTNRCFRLDNMFAVVDGFTITRGAVPEYGGYGGGVLCNVGGQVLNCTVVSNVATLGGGIYCYYAGVVSNCLVVANSAGAGGGIYLDRGGIAVQCIVAHNAAPNMAGGVMMNSGGACMQCVVSNNTAPWAGGVYANGDGVLDRCAVTGNRSVEVGGVACNGGGELRSCLVAYNVAETNIGGVSMAAGGLLENCTVVSNTAMFGEGGGVFSWHMGTLSNTIVYWNRAFTNDNWSTNGYGYPATFDHSCSPGLSGNGNITNDPLFVSLAGSNFRLQSGSPCRNAGTNQPWMAGATDLDGNPRVAEACVDMGAYECMPPPPPFVDITTASTTLPYTVSGFAVAGTNNSAVVGRMRAGNVAGGPVYDFDAALSWTSPPVHLYYGNNQISVSGTNVAGTMSIDYVVVYWGAGLTNYVAPNGGHVRPFTNGWAGAATNIQAAVDIAIAGNVVLVSNGIYASGGTPYPGYTLTNRVMVAERIALKSLNGPDATFILGAQDPAPGGCGSNAVRCVLMRQGLLEGFTLTNGATCTTGDWLMDMCGGGFYAFWGSGVRVVNCVMTANRAHRSGGAINDVFSDTVFDRCTIVGNQAGFAGGADHGTFFNSLFACNIATSNNFLAGGAVWVANLINCTVVSNASLTAWGGGGVGCSVSERAYLTNCIVWGNVAPSNPASANFTTGGFNAVHTCTEPMPATGYGNLATNPSLVNLGAGDYHLDPLSLCREAGTNQPWMFTATDLDGNPRIMPAGTVGDMGCYEVVPEPAIAGAMALFVICYSLLVRQVRQVRQVRHSGSS